MPVPHNEKEEDAQQKTCIFLNVQNRVPPMKAWMHFKNVRPGPEEPYVPNMCAHTHIFQWNIIHKSA